MLASDSDPPLRPKGLAKEGRRSLLTLTPSLTRRPSQEGTTLASDSDPPLRPEGLAEDRATLTSDSNPLLRPGVH